VTNQDKLHLQKPCTVPYCIVPV